MVAPTLAFAPLSPLAFAAVVWGSVGLVVLVFVYELITVVRERT
ncbi:hypothetical protein ACFQJD_04865 [Haloplanus sp. GCM10025708]